MGTALSGAAPRGRLAAPRHGGVSLKQSPGGLLCRLGTSPTNRSAGGRRPRLLHSHLRPQGSQKDLPQEDGSRERRGAAPAAPEDGSSPTAAPAGPLRGQSGASGGRRRRPRLSAAAPQVRRSRASRASHRAAGGAERSGPPAARRENRGRGAASARPPRT